MKHVPKALILANLEGSWRGTVRWRRSSSGSTTASLISSSGSSLKKGELSLLLPPHFSCLSRPYAHADVRVGSSPDDSKDWNVLLDLNHLNVVPKTVRPLERQLPDESRKLWEKVTNKLVGKEFGEANKYKQAIEQRQREEAAERKKKGVE